MSEVVKNFYLLRYKRGRCTAETIGDLVTEGKLTQDEADEILNSV